MFVEPQAGTGTIKEAHSLINIKARPQIAKKSCNNIMLCNWSLKNLQGCGEVEKCPVLV
jgi:hypothetical protein